MSRKTRSGVRSPMRLTASKPLPHSATTSTSAWEARYSRSRARAGASSSTTTVRRVRSVEVGIGGVPVAIRREEVQDDPEAGRLREDLEARAVLVERFDAPAHVLESHAF